MPRIPTVTLDRERVRAALRQSGQTRAEIAARAGLSTGFIGDVLRGRAVGRLSAASFARAMRLPLGSLIAEPRSTGATETADGNEPAPRVAAAG